MAQEGSEASVASSNTATNNKWWEIHPSRRQHHHNHHAAGLPSWSSAAVSRWQLQSHPAHLNSSAACEEDLSISNGGATSFTTASNHSGLSMDSSSAATADLSGSEPPMENHLWSQVLLNVGSGGDMHHSHDSGENFLEGLTSKSLTTEMFDPACDYLKKMDSSWEYTNSSSLNSFEKQMSSFNGGMIEPQRLNNLSDLVSNWSIAPPNPQLDHHMPLSSCNISVNPSMAQYSMSNISHIKHEIPNSPSSNYPGNGMVGEANRGYQLMTSYEHGMKGESQHQDIGATMPSFLRPCSTNGIGYQIGLNNSVVGSGMAEVPWSNTRNLTDLISFGSYLNKPAVDFRPSKSYVKGSDTSDIKKQGFETGSVRGNVRGSGTTNEGKKKRSEESSEALYKKSKQESSTASSLKLQAPKVKLGDRITALQQIVSPFGKTDTASVLLEAIGYIKFLQEQVQLLSDPYMKSGASKDHNSWGGLERKDKVEPKLDLRSRGLCLVPISCTPQVYRENSGPDYWTPTYRGSLYR